MEKEDKRREKVRKEKIHPVREGCLNQFRFRLDGLRQGNKGMEAGYLFCQ